MSAWPFQNCYYRCHFRLFEIGCTLQWGTWRATINHQHFIIFIFFRIFTVAVGQWFFPGSPVSYTSETVISSSFYRLAMSLALTEALTLTLYYVYQTIYGWLNETFSVCLYFQCRLNPFCSILWMWTGRMLSPMSTTERWPSRKVTCRSSTVTWTAATPNRK